ncbi:pentatricopeptide repeat-containing protein [Tripterygium wilfordii]|uniref:Pentatricopeptide repeat-containing protein n=1 Tax=Tripterygium wilfordii TaxID=458696 RepID=A0A7J7C3W4_TRIWF|nr:pentatricopeptide repeat-containing protein At2g37310 [Tripterygium wilfordii]KAF5728813.1 pentatricopeptide repeat-containing protein [Tripterygium wilfordii]
MKATNGQIQQALQSLKAGQNGLDCGAYGLLLQHFSDQRLPRLAKQLHARIVLFSVTPDNFLASKLIHFYAKTGFLTRARHLFDGIPKRNTFSYNAMLISYSFNSMHSQVLQLFSASLASSDFPRPNHYTMTCVLKALSSCSFCGSRSSACEVHGFVLRCGFDEDVFVQNALITYYSKCNDVATARAVFDTMQERDVVSWNAMIGGYSQNGFYEECKGMYKKMLNSSGRPDGVTVVSVLQACGQSEDLVFGIEVHRFVVEAQLEMDISVCNALIGLYAKCGSLDYARQLFEEMSEKDEVTYGAIISGYMRHGFVDDAINLFLEAKTPGLSNWNAMISGLVQNNRHEGVFELVREMQSCGFRPNVMTISSVLPSLSYFSNLKGGKEIHCYALRNNLYENIFVATAIIDTYAKSGFLHGAQGVFDQSRSRNLIIWTAIISAYAAHGDSNAATSLFDDMLSCQIQPDPVTFTAVLTALAHTGAVDEAWKIFNTMFLKYGMEPSVEHYACMVGVLSRAGRLSEAVDLISRMPVKPTAKVWGALLNGASVTGDVELGKFVCDHLFEIEPENTGNYIIMANLYSKAGRWEEANKVRKKMNRVGLKKIPGSSWIETSGGLKNFIARDLSNDGKEEIYTMLEGLLELMREEGYFVGEEFDEEIVCG